MSVALRVGQRSWPVGSDSLLHAFFSTIAVQLEGGAWGSRFPITMRELYSGRLSVPGARAARAEIAQIAVELEQLSPAELVWDAEQPGRPPPWGDDIHPSINSLAAYFVTSEGRILITVLDEALAAASDEGSELEIG